MDSSMGGGGGLGSASGSIELDASKALAALNQFSAGLRNVSKQSQSMGTGLLGFASQYQQQFTTMGTGLMGVGAAITGAFGLMANTAASFEQQMSAVGSVTGATGKSLSALREEALRLGADTSFSASEAAQAMEVMAKAGVSVQDILAGATEDIMNLATATGADVPQAAEVASAAMNVFGVSAEEAANVISRSANVSALDVNDWALAMKSAGPVAAALGYDIDDLAAAMIILGDAGTSGEVAATALRNIMINMADPAGEAAEALAQYGVAATNVDGSVRELDAVTADLATTWGTLTDAERLQLAQSVAGRDGAAAFMTIMDAQTQAVQNNSNAFDDNKARMGEVGTASEQAAQRLDNFRGSWDQLMGTVETISITFGSTVLPVLRAVVDGVNTLLQGVLSLPAPLQTAIMGLTGIAGAAALGAGGFLLLLPRIAETRSALLDLSKAPGVIGRLSSSMLGLGTSATSASAGVGGLRGSLMGLVRAHPALLGLGLIAGGLYAAYRTNFLGIGDLVDGVTGKVKSVFADMSAAFNASSESAGIAAENVATFAEATDVVDGKTVYTAFKTNAAGEKEAVGEIIESYKNADGMTAQVLIQGEDGEYWATIDLATGEISNAEIPVSANTKPFSERLNDALQVLEDRFDEAGMGWAASIVDNLQGVVKSVASMGSKLRTVFTALSPGIKDFLSKIATAAVVLAPLGAGLGLIAKAASTLSPVLTVARVAIQGVGLAIAVLTSPIGLVVAGIVAMVAGAIYAYQNFETFRNIVDSVAGTLRDFATNAIDKVTEAWDTLKAAFDADGWSGVWDTIVQAVQDGLQSIMDAIAGVDWAGVLQASWDVLQGASDWLLGKLGDLSGALWSWFSGAVSGVNWGNVLSTAWDALLGAAGWILDKVVAGIDLAGDLISWFFNAVNSVNWSNILSVTWDALSGAASWIKDKILAGVDLATDLLTWFTGVVTGVNWSQVFTDAIDTLASAGEWILDKIISYHPGVLIGTWFYQQMRDINWQSLFDLAINTLKDAGQWIVDKVQLGASAAYEGVKSWASGLWQGIIDAFQPIIDTAVGMLNGLIDQLNRIPGVNIPKIGGIEQIGTDADAARGKVVDLQSALTSMATGGIMRDTNGPSSPPGGSDYADPYRPHEGGNSNVEYRNFDGSAITAAFAGVRDAAIQAAAAVNTSGASLGALMAQSPAVTAFGGAASGSFLMSGSAAQTGLSPISGIAAAMAAGLTGSAIPAFAGIQASAVTNFAGMLSAVASNTASASSTAGTNASSMNAKVAGEMAGMQVKSAAQMVLLAASAASNFSTMQTAATTAGSRLASEMINGASRAASAVQSQLGRIPGIVSSIGGNAAGAARNVGAMIGAGMAQGMESALGRIRAAANAMVAAAETALRARAMIASPSKLFRRLGEHTGEGYALGITRMSRDVAASGRALVDALLQSLQGVTTGSLIPALEAATNSPQAIGRRLADTLSGITNGMVTDSLIPALEQALSASKVAGYGSSVTPAYAYATAPPAPVVQHHYHDHRQFFALEQGAYQRLVDQAERGGTYAKTMSQNDAFTQYLGGN